MMFDHDEEEQYELDAIEQFEKSNLKYKDVPPELIEIKRIQIKLKRKIKELKNENNSILEDSIYND